MVPGCRAKGLESLRVVVAFAVAFGVLLTFSTCGGGESTEQTPPPSIDVRSPSEETISPTPPAGDTSFRLVFQESGATEDKIWRVSPSNPTNREPVATIKHLYRRSRHPPPRRHLRTRSRQFFRLIWAAC